MILCSLQKMISNCIKNHDNLNTNQWRYGMRLVVAFFWPFSQTSKTHFPFSWLQILFQLIRLCEWREYRWNLGNRIGFNTGVDTTKRISVCLLDLPNLVVKYYIEVPLILLLLLLQRCVEQGVSKYLFKNSSLIKSMSL